MKNLGSIARKELSEPMLMSISFAVRPDEKKAGVVLRDPDAWTKRSFSEAGLTIQWDQSVFEDTEVTLGVLGYSEAEGVAEDDQFKIMKELKIPNSGSFLLKIDNFICENAAVCDKHHIGYLSLAGNASGKVT